MCLSRGNQATLNSNIQPTLVAPDATDAHCQCCALVALLRGHLTQPIEHEQGIHLSIAEQAGLDEVFELLQCCLDRCQP